MYTLPMKEWLRIPSILKITTVAFGIAGTGHSVYSGAEAYSQWMSDPNYKASSAYTTNAGDITRANDLLYYEPERYAENSFGQSIFIKPVLPHPEQAEEILASVAADLKAYGDIENSRRVEEIIPEIHKEAEEGVLVFQQRQELGNITVAMSTKAKEHTAKVPPYGNNLLTAGRNAFLYVVGTIGSLSAITAFESRRKNASTPSHIQKAA